MATDTTQETLALRGQLDQATRQAESMRRVIESISSELSLEPLLTRIVASAAELIGAMYGSIGLVVDTASGPVVRVAAIYNMPPRELGAEMPSGIGLAGRVLRDRRPLLLDRYDQLDRPTLPELADHAVIGMPIWWADRMIGFFGIGTEPPRRFSERDSDTLALFARHAAIAIENARRFEIERRRAVRIAIINRIGRSIAGSLSLDQIFQTAVESICTDLQFTYVAAGVVDPVDPDLLVLLSHAGVHVDDVPAGYRQSINEGIVGAAARTRKRMLVNNVAQDPRYLSLLTSDAIRAELAVPIVVDSQLLGVLNIESERPIGEEDAQGIEIVADQLGIAMVNARLFTDTQRTLSETQLLYETSRRISTAMDIDDVIAAYLEQVATRGRYACTVLLHEHDEAGKNHTLRMRGRWSPHDRQTQPREVVCSTFGALDPPLDAGQTITIADLRADSHIPPALRGGQAALALIPLMARGQRIGLILLSYPEAHPWPAADIQLYQATAAQLASAIDSRWQQLLLFERGQQVAVLEERQRLARDLHDSVTQLLFSMTLIAQSIAPAWRRSPAEGEQRIGRLLQLSQAALAEMRSLLTEWHPPAEAADAAAPLPDPAISQRPAGIPRVQQDGLIPAIRAHIAGVAGDSLPVDLQGTDYLRQAPATEEALFRIVQEAFNNIVKHSAATHAAIRLSVDEHGTHLRITDNGVGLRLSPATMGHVARPGSHSSIGLHSMRERAQERGGTIRISAPPGSGTTIEVLLPREDGDPR